MTNQNRKQFLAYLGQCYHSFSRPNVGSTVKHDLEDVQTTILPDEDDDLQIHEKKQIEEMMKLVARTSSTILKR
ncbi:hypothetical protein H671_2g4811 [Cricetulus griseus]|nr:hypothetical protein H671_2g4811 [Cricetulus griseus]